MATAAALTTPTTAKRATWLLIDHAPDSILVDEGDAKGKVPTS